MAKILVADDDEVFLARVKRLLEDGGHDVVTAATPAQALQAFETNRLDLAILDYRLRDGKPGDRSGLDVAIKSDARVPKIIVSAPAERMEIMETVRTSAEGLALAVAFLAKGDISVDTSKLAEAVNDALKIRKLWMRQARESVSPELHQDYREVSRLASVQLILHLLANAAFVILMVWAAVYLHQGVLPMLFLMVGIVAGEVTNVLLAKGKEELLVARADRYHAELLQVARFEQLLAACDSLGTPAAISQAKLELVRSASEKWIGARRETETERVSDPTSEREQVS